MTKQYQIGGAMVTYLPSHLGGTAVAPNGTAVTLSLPAGASTIYFRAEGAAAYYSVNAGSASALSPGYVPVDSNDMIFECDNLGTVSVFTGTGGTVHIQYY